MNTLRFERITCFCNEQLGLLEGSAEGIAEDKVKEAFEDASEGMSTRILVSSGSQQNLEDDVHP